MYLCETGNKMMPTDFSVHLNSSGMYHYRESPSLHWSPWKFSLMGSTSSLSFMSVQGYEALRLSSLKCQVRPMKVYSVRAFAYPCHNSIVRWHVYIKSCHFTFDLSLNSSFLWNSLRAVVFEMTLLSKELMKPQVLLYEMCPWVNFLALFAQKTDKGEMSAV